MNPKLCLWCGKENLRKGKYCTLQCTKAASKAAHQRRMPIPHKIWKIPVDVYVHNGENSEFRPDDDS